MKLQNESFSIPEFSWVGKLLITPPNSVCSKRSMELSSFHGKECRTRNVLKPNASLHRSNRRHIATASIWLFYLQYLTFISVIPFISSDNFLFFLSPWKECKITFVFIASNVLVSSPRQPQKLMTGQAGCNLQISTGLHGSTWFLKHEANVTNICCTVKVCIYTPRECETIWIWVLGRISKPRPCNWNYAAIPIEELPLYF